MYLLTVLVDAWSSRVMSAMACSALRFFQENRILWCSCACHTGPPSPHSAEGLWLVSPASWGGFSYGKNLSDVYG